MIAAGIDPGLAHVGIAVVEIIGGDRKLLSAEVISTPTSAALESRWSAIYRTAIALLAAHEIAVLGIEDQHGAWIGHAARGTTSAASLRTMECVGMFRAWAIERGIAVTIVSPKEVKLAVLGKGASRAGKHQVLRGLRASVKGIPTGTVPEHASDAMGVALAAGSRFHVTDAIERARMH